jgi:hypothetical protein
MAVHVVWWWYGVVLLSAYFVGRQVERVFHPNHTDIINGIHLRAEEVQQPLAQPPGRVHAVVLLVRLPGLPVGCVCVVVGGGG